MKKKNELPGNRAVEVEGDDGSITLSFISPISVKEICSWGGVVVPRAKTDIVDGGEDIDIIIRTRVLVSREAAQALRDLLNAFLDDDE